MAGRSRTDYLAQVYWNGKSASMSSTEASHIIRNPFCQNLISNINRINS